jgi:Spy/CpxP family protein refolding chaperone
MRTQLALVFLIALGGVAAAQPDDPGLRARIRDRVRVAVEQKLIAQLQLDAQTAARLQQVLDKYDAQIADLQRDAGQAHRELKQYLDGNGNDAAVINRLADRMLDDRGRVQRLELDRSREVRQVLTPQQYGRLMIIYPQVMKEVKTELWKAIAMKRGQGQPPAPPPELE